MENILNIYVKEDDSVQKKLSKRAVKLQKKYYKRRKFDEKYLKYKSGFRKVLSKLSLLFGIVIVIISCLLCYCNLTSRINNMVPSFCGYSALKVESGSMTASGIKKFDTIIARTCDPKTISRGDIIVFYVYNISSLRFASSGCKVVLEEDIPEIRYVFKKEEMLGIQSNEIKAAAKANSKRVVHQVIEVYEDYKGERWFKTKGTSNPTEDSWKINENYIIGLYDGSDVAKTMSVVVGAMTSPVGSIVLLIIPIVIIAIIVVMLSLKDLQIAMLENDIVEEKRKLTDDVCVKNNVGYQMSSKTKYKVLALATEDEKRRYVSLLWKDGGTPNAVKKYIIRKQLLLQTNKELNELNRICERKFEEGENPRKIALFYDTQKEKIQEKYEKKRKQIKEIRKANLKLKEEQENAKKKNKKNKKSKKVVENVQPADLKMEENVEIKPVKEVKVKKEKLKKEKPTKPKSTSSNSKK